MHLRASIEASPFAEEFRAFARAQATPPLPEGRLLFYGSSSIRLWDSLERDFRETPVLNRGFGGSTLEECVREMDWLVFPLRPRAVVFYAGDNDLENGAEPERLARLFAEFLWRLGEQLGPVPVAFISIKPSPARFWNVAKIRRANELIRGVCADSWQVRYLDIFPQMLEPHGGPRHELYAEDGLHLNGRGYALWTAVVQGWLREQRLIG